MVALNPAWSKPLPAPKPVLSASSLDPGNLVDLLDEGIAVRVDHTALDGGQHVTIEDLDRIAADLLPMSSWKGGCA